MKAPPDTTLAAAADAFGEIVDLPAGEAEARLAELGRADPELSALVRRLLDRDRAAGDFLQADAGQFARRLLEELPVEDPVSGRKAGDRVGPYRLTELLGAGGMGEVWVAERTDGQFEQKVALKLLKAGSDSEGIRRRFFQERQVLARLDHPHIARLLDGGTADGVPYFAMELVVGQPITDYCRTERIGLAQRLELVVACCEAVEAAHRPQVVHRDIKPSNVLVTPDGRVKLLDFGIAKILSQTTDAQSTRLDERVLTPSYAAPEQILGEPVSTATDVYALGVVLFELLTGALPHRRSAASSARLARELDLEAPEKPSRAVARIDPERRGLPEDDEARLAARLADDLDAIVLQALRREPERRYRDAAELAQDLRRHLKGMPVAARPDTLGYRARKFTRRHRAGVAAVALAFAALICGSAAALWQAGVARAAARRADAQAALVKLLLARSSPSGGMSTLETGAAPPPVRLRLEEFQIVAGRSSPSLSGFGGALRSALAAVPGLDVTAPSRNGPPGSAADLLLAGTLQVSRSALDIRIALQEPGGRILWTDVVQRGWDGSLKSLDAAALAVADAAGPALNDAIVSRWSRPRSEAVTELLMRSRALYPGHGRVGWQAAVALADRALASDPRSPEALVRRSELRFGATVFVLTTSDPMREIALAREEARRALALDPGLAGGYIALSSGLAVSGDLDGAFAQLRAAQRLAPEDPRLPANFEWLYRWAGLFSNAAAAGQTVLARDPAAGNVRSHVADDLWSLGRREEAFRLLREGQRNGHASAVAAVERLAEIALEEKRDEDAVRACATISSHEQVFRLCDFLGAIAAIRTRRDPTPATALLSREEYRRASDGYFVFQRGCLLAALGKTAEAIDSLEAAAARGFQAPQILASYPGLESVQTLPRFRALRERLARERTRREREWVLD